MDNHFFYDEQSLWTSKTFIPSLNDSVGEFQVLQDNSYQTQQLVLQRNELYMLKPQSRAIDLQNAILESINDKGIRLTKNYQTFDFFGDVKKWLPMLKKYCLQTNFTQLYVIQKQIGKGNYGKVYKAQRKVDQQEFAVKVFEKNKLVKSADRPALIKELDILRKLDYSGVLSLVEAFESNQFIFLVYELLRGGELYENLKQIAPLMEEKAAKIINQLLNSIEYIHNLGILHRDLKPENILLREKGQLEDLVIADFGLADYYRKDGKYLFTRCGTPGYVAPEVLQDQIYDFKVDVYSIGILLYIMIIGKSPFRGKAYEEVVYLNYKGAIDYSDLKVSEAAIDLLKLMLDPNPHKRGSIEQIRRHPWFRKWLRKSHTILVKRIVKLDKSDQLTPSTNDSLNIENSPLSVSSGSKETLKKSAPKQLGSVIKSQYFRTTKYSISKSKFQVSQLL